MSQAQFPALQSSPAIMAARCFSEDQGVTEMAGTQTLHGREVTAQALHTVALAIVEA